MTTWQSGNENRPSERGASDWSSRPSARRRALAGEYNDLVYGVLVQFRDALYPRPAQDEMADPVVDDYWISEQPPHWVIYRDTVVRTYGGWQCERSERVYAVTRV